MGNEYYTYGLYFNERIVYVGKGSGARLNQHQHHLSQNKHKNRFLQSAYNKYILRGGGVFSVTKIKTRMSERYSLLHEQALILKFGRRVEGSGILYNILEGGQRGMTGFKHSEQTKLKMRERNIGRKHSTQTKEKMSNTKMGVSNWKIIGRSVSDVTRSKMSISRMGVSPENKGELKGDPEVIANIKAKYVPYKYSFNKLAKEYKLSKPTVIKYYYL